MVADSRRLGFPLLAGSSLPVTWRLPDLELPLECEIEDALMVGVGGSDDMDYHALEAMQCMVERRRGGETGVAGGADGRRGGGLEGRGGGAVVERAVGSRALSQRHAPRPHGSGWPHPGPARQRRATKARSPTICHTSLSTSMA